MARGGYIYQAQRKLRFSSCAGWSSPVAREAHNLEVLGSNPSPATYESPESSRTSGLSPFEILNCYLSRGTETAESLSSAETITLQRRNHSPLIEKSADDFDDPLPDDILAGFEGGSGEPSL